MTIFRVEHNANYTVVNNFICKDKRLSWKAKGIWLYAFSRPNDWEFNIKDLLNQSTDRKESVYSGLNELEKCGYLHRDKDKRNAGKFSKAEWVFYETPQPTQDLKKCLPCTGNPDTVKPDTGNQPQLSTEKKLSIDKKQQQAKPVSAAVSSKSSKKEETKIYPILQSVDIPLHDKVEITSKYTIDEVTYAVKWATHPKTKLNKTLAAAIKWACKYKPDMPEERVDHELVNKTYALKYKQATSGRAKVEVWNKYVEITQSGSSYSFCLEYDVKGFIDQFKNALRKHKFKILED